MSQKRGISQPDWIISMAVFILYLAWFFIVIRPVLSPETKESLPVDDLKAEFMENASWQVNATPIILKSNISSGSEPIIINFPFAGSTLNYAIKEGYWQIEDGRLIFMASFPMPSMIYSLVHSTYNYTKPTISSSIEASDQTAKSGNMQANFRDGLLDSARYYNALRIVSFTMDIGNEPINKNVNEFTSNSISAKYKVITPSLNSTFYVFENNSKIYNYIDTIDEKSVYLNMLLHKYDRYYVDSGHQGSIKYNVTECDSFDADYIDFIDDEYGLAFILNEDAKIVMCHDKELILNISNTFNGTFSYRIVFHSKGVGKDALEMPYTAVFGAKNIYGGLSGEKIRNLKSQNYSEMKSQWDMNHDFNITVSNSTSTFLRFGVPPYKNVNVHSKQYNLWKLDEYANQTRVTLNILMW